MIDLRTPLDQAHARDARRHALKRLHERFGIRMGMANLRALEADLVLGRYRWLGIERRAIVFEVPIGAVITYPLFNVNLWAIATFFDHVDRARPGLRLLEHG